MKRKLCEYYYSDLVQPTELKKRCFGRVLEI